MRSRKAVTGDCPTGWREGRTRRLRDGGEHVGVRIEPPGGMAGMSATTGNDRERGPERAVPGIRAWEGRRSGGLLAVVPVVGDVLGDPMHGAHADADRLGDLPHAQP